MAKDEYEQIWSGQWTDYAGPFDLACCGCCFVHTVSLRVSEDGKPQYKFIERKGETKRLRKKHGITVSRKEK